MTLPGPRKPGRVVVVAAVVERDDRVLVTERIADTHLAEHWEFPGGKMEEGEDHRQCLAREMREELDVEVSIGRELHATSFEYPDRTVDLHFYICAIIGEPRPVLGQRVRWVSLAELGTLRVPPADRELIRAMTDRGIKKSAGVRTESLQSVVKVPRRTENGDAPG